MSTNLNTQETADEAGNTFAKKLMPHYQTIAYALTLTAVCYLPYKKLWKKYIEVQFTTLQYAFSFGEYLFLRLTYFLNPENVIQHSSCTNDSNGYQMIVGKGAINYTVVIVAFISVATFQIMCFFGLTVSEKWIKYRLSTDNDPMTKLRAILSQQIRSTIENTLYPTFVCYTLASASVWLIIFYMFGIRDSVNKLASRILLYIFDAIILVYFFNQLEDRTDSNQTYRLTTFNILTMPNYNQPVTKLYILR
uniref:G protein-coupled receptor n=1 Tax=Syphacia muris TaxID=451379 RepID=A0A0N5AI64_9BILA